MKTKLIGIGSPQFQDEAGWMMIDAISKIDSLKNSYDLLKLDRPGLRLIEEIENQSKVIIYDAAIGLNPGEIKPIKPQDYSIHYQPLSSHGVGVIQALEMAQLLGKYPKELTLIAIGAGEAEIITAAIKLYLKNELVGLSYSRFLGLTE